MQKGCDEIGGEKHRDAEAGDGLDHGERSSGEAGEQARIKGQQPEHSGAQNEKGDIRHG